MTCVRGCADGFRFDDPHSFGSFLYGARVVYSVLWPSMHVNQLGSLCLALFRSVRQDVRLSAPSEVFGCISQKCWAGVYVDSTSKSVLHLAKGGGAFFSPGTAAGSHGNELRWKAKEGFLYIVDSDNNPFSWPGAASYLRRDPVQAGKLAGFRVEVGTSNGTALVKSAHLNRDSLGFLYPGCTYVLSWRPGLPFRAGNARENRVVVNRDGTITDAENGRRVARWSFPEALPVVDGVDDAWATGDEVVLLLDGEYLQVRMTISNEVQYAELSKIRFRPACHIDSASEQDVLTSYDHQRVSMANY